MRGTGFLKRKLFVLKEKGFYRGVNLGGWLSQCDYSEERLDNFIKDKDFARIKSFGFDHVRIPIDYNVIQNNDGTVKENGLRRIDGALELCRRYGLNTVLDLHKTQGFSFDSGEHETGFFENSEYQELFYGIWETFARRWGSSANSVAFELLNEVTEEKFLPEWKKISRECVRRIRKYAPSAIVLLGSWNWNSAKTLRFLDPPYDGNVLYNFHFYEPHSFTHQGAYWETPFRDISGRVSYEESGCSEEYIEEFIRPALEKADKENTELYCGEYGVIDIVPTEEAIKWFRDVNKVFEKYGIARSLWSYKEMDFGLTDSRWDCLRDELLSCI